MLGGSLIREGGLWCLLEIGRSVALTVHLYDGNAAWLKIRQISKPPYMFEVSYIVT